MHNSIFPSDDTRSATESKLVRYESGAYVGADKMKAPYGMLTQRGVEQLARVGIKLRQRYGSFLSGDIVNGHDTDINVNISSIYARSTNYCRTHMSLRSLLYGLLGHAEFDSTLGTLKSTVSNTGYHQIEEATNSKVTIFSRSRVIETMFPRSCPLLTHHTRQSYKHENMKSSISGYEDFTKLVQTVLGIHESDYWFYKNTSSNSITSTSPELESHSKGTNHRWEWADIKEVLTCHLEHKSQMCPSGLDLDAAVTKSTEIASKIWHDKYSVRIVTYHVSIKSILRTSVLN